MTNRSQIFKNKSDKKRFIKKIFSKNPDKYQIYESNKRCDFCNKDSNVGRKYLKKDGKLLAFICSECLKELIKQYPKLTNKFHAKRTKRQDKNRAISQLKEAEEKRLKAPKTDSSIIDNNIPNYNIPMSELLQGKRGRHIFDYFICNRCGKQCTSGWVYSNNIKLCDNCKVVVKFKPYITIFYIPMGGMTKWKKK